jgi:hypothetical protein
MADASTTFSTGTDPSRGCSTDGDSDSNASPEVLTGCSGTRPGRDDAADQADQADQAVQDFCPVPAYTVNVRVRGLSDERYPTARNATTNH